MDDQVTYPLTTSLTGTPGVKTIRSMSGFGLAMVFIIFKDDVDYYWARSRVLERINVAQQRLPAGVMPVPGPDAGAADDPGSGAFANHFPHFPGIQRWIKSRLIMVLMARTFLYKWKFVPNHLSVPPPFAAPAGGSRSLR